MNHMVYPHRFRLILIRHALLFRQVVRNLGANGEQKRALMGNGARIRDRKSSQSLVYEKFTSDFETFDPKNVTPKDNDTTMKNSEMIRIGFSWECND